MGEYLIPGVVTRPILALFLSVTPIVTVTFDLPTILEAKTAPYIELMIQISVIVCHIMTSQNIGTIKTENPNI